MSIEEHFMIDPPTPDAILTPIQSLDLAVDRIEKTLALHQEQNPEALEAEPWCSEDGNPWPCRTVRILTGEERPEPLPEPLPRGER